MKKKENLAPRARFELATLRLTAECSTIELPGNRRNTISFIVIQTSKLSHSNRGAQHESEISKFSVSSRRPANWSPHFEGLRSGKSTIIRYPTESYRVSRTDRFTATVSIRE